MMIINKKNARERPNSIGLYIHIPFCQKKCGYCDFLSFDNCSKEDHSRYIDALLSEIKYYSNSYGVYGKNIPLNTIFIGGGTPSLIDEALIAKILETVRTCFSLSCDAEITLESNPKTLTREKLLVYHQYGINRLSIGAQSFDNGVLKEMGRIHCEEDFFIQYGLAREVGFKNINIDLMFAVPKQTRAMWTKTLEKALKLSPEHISFYSLQLEENTEFYQRFLTGELEQISDDIDRQMYHEAVATLSKAGLHHYEISNSAKPGWECKHNLKYWSLEDYLGVGLGAHSFVEGVRFSNTRSFRRYIGCFCQRETKKNWVKGFTREEVGVQTAPWVDWNHVNDVRDLASEFMFTGLRKVEGVRYSEFENLFSQRMNVYYREEWSTIEDYIKEGFLISEGDHLRFSLKGIDVSNGILSEFV